MIDLKAGFHNIPFEEVSSYDSTFVTTEASIAG